MIEGQQIQSSPLDVQHGIDLCLSVHQKCSCGCWGHVGDRVHQTDSSPCPGEQPACFIWILMEDVLKNLAQTGTRNLQHVYTEGQIGLRGRETDICYN